MPVMPGYLYADTPHEKTVTGAGYRYGCHTSLTADGGPRGVQTKYYAHPLVTSAPGIHHNRLASHALRAYNSVVRRCVRRLLESKGK